MGFLSGGHPCKQAQTNPLPLSSPPTWHSGLSSHTSLPFPSSSCNLCCCSHKENKTGVSAYLQSSKAGFYHLHAALQISVIQTAIF